jgi:hypothetical protein
VLSDTPQTARMPSGPVLALSPDESRLALLGVVDFEGDWEAFEAATPLVVDGPAKANLIRERLAPVAAQFSDHLAADVNVLELLAARHWFDTQSCQRAARPKHAGEQTPAAVTFEGDEAGAREERA